MAEWNERARAVIERNQMHPEELVERGGRVRGVIRRITMALGNWAEDNLDHIDDPRFMAEEAIELEQQARDARLSL